jgi:HAD superfamily hydrolase (TIGR01490 family)
LGASRVIAKICEAPGFIKGLNFISTIAAFFDLDGTLTSAHVWQGIIDYFRVHNQRQWTHRIYMAYHFPLYVFWKAGLISDEAFRKPWPTHLGWYLRGFNLDQANRVWDWVAQTRVKPTWRADICHVLDQHKAQGDLTILVSGTPVPLLQRLAEEINADHVIGTGLEIKDGVFTGRNSSPACIGVDKVTLTRKYLQQHQIAIDFSSSFAYADSISDHHMLAMVGNPVATYPDAELRDFALQNDWQIFPTD